MALNVSRENDPRYHAEKVMGELLELAGHLREDIAKVPDAKAQALFETTAEVLMGLGTAFEHFIKRSEPALAS